VIAYIADFLTLAAIFTVFVLGLNLQFGITGLINFGHVGFMAIGSYTMVILMLRAGWHWLPAGLGGIAVAALFSLFIGLAALRLREDYLAIVTIGVAEIVRMVANNEVWLTRGPQGMFGFATPLDGLGLSVHEYRVAFLILCVSVMLAVLAVITFATNSPWGRVLKGIREDEDVAMSLGKNTRVFKIQSLALGSAFAGLAGALMAFHLRFINPHQFQPLTTFEGWMIMVLGGTGNHWAMALGSILYFGLFRITRPFEQVGLGGLSGQQIAAMRIMLVGLALILLMMYRPQGLTGRKEELSLDR